MKLKNLSISLLCLCFFCSTTVNADNNSSIATIDNGREPIPLLGSNFTYVKSLDFTQKHNNLPNEGFAVYRNNAFVIYQTGICDIYNLKTGKFVNSFHLGSYATSNHANAANFGVEFPKGNPNFPAIYISECSGQGRCFVESITTTGSKLIQTISLNLSKFGKRGLDWAVDEENSLLYCVQTGNRGTNYNIFVFRLPKLSAGSNVVLNDSDLLNQWNNIPLSGVCQGLYVRKGYAYLPMSGGANGLNGCALHEINLTSKNYETTTINLGPNFANMECEDLYFYKNSLLISFNGTGVYYFANK